MTGSDVFAGPLAISAACPHRTLLDSGILCVREPGGRGALVYTLGLAAGGQDQSR